MSRVNVFDGIELVGWFDDDTAQRFQEDTYWNGNNHISIATGSQWDHEELYYTAKGSWVLHSWSNYQGTRDRYQFINKETARKWLLSQNHDDDVIQIFGPIEEEYAPILE